MKRGWGLVLLDLKNHKKHRVVFLLWLMLEHFFKPYWISAFSIFPKTYWDTRPCPLINWITIYVFAALKINTCALKMHPIAFLVFLTSFLGCSLRRLLNWESIRLNNNILDYIISQYIIPSFISHSMIMGLRVWSILASSRWVIYVLSTFVFFFFSRNKEEI